MAGISTASVIRNTQFFIEFSFIISSGFSRIGGSFREGVEELLMAAEESGEYF
jgi:hypothetical protein